MMNLIELIEDRAVVATKACDDRRDEKKDAGVRVEVDMMSYRNGEAVAYIDASKLAKAELRRLCNRFQNGQLSVDDFGVL